MSMFERIQKFLNLDQEGPAMSRVAQMVAPHVDKPRPVRAMVYREANVTYDTGYKRRGIVLDYSDTGVRLRFPTNEILPENVRLNANSIGLEGMARVVWQKGSEAGFRILGS